MKNQIKKFIKNFAPEVVLNQINNAQLRVWKKNGCPVPPPHIVKQMAIADYQKKYKPRILVETGTFYGDMIEAQKKKFDQVISIELAEHFVLKAQERFKKDKNVNIVHGSSENMLPIILKEINEPILFWLDGHYSGGVTAKGEKNCPIFEELSAIFHNQTFNHVILIDDARCFIGENDYPTIEELTAFIKSKNDKYQVQVKHDIIRCVI